MVQLPLVERWESVDGDPPLIAALRAFPSGLAAFLPALLLPFVICLLHFPACQLTESVIESSSPNSTYAGSSLAVYPEQLSVSSCIFSVKATRPVQGISNGSYLPFSSVLRRINALSPLSGLSDSFGHSCAVLIVCF